LTPLLPEKAAVLGLAESIGPGCAETVAVKANAENVPAKSCLVVLICFI
jgi:hypothetical protein